MAATNTRYKYGFIIIVCVIVVLRFIYSLTTEFWFPDEDVLQIYLIGLKSFTTHTYPFFGADLVYNGSQIPGALQGYLVSAMWYVWKIPEAPYITLNILLTLSLGFFAWYASKRLPQINKLLIWVYVLLIPWSVCYFTRLVNPSHVIPGAILFFIGVFETYEPLRMNILPKPLCYFFFGFGIFWIFQLHMSWVLLGPFTVVAFYYLLKTKNVKTIATNTASFLAGCLTSGSLLIPTLLNYGLASEKGKSVSGMVELHLEHAGDIFKMLSTYLAYASFDVTRFIGGNTEERMQFMKDYVWAAPFTGFVGVIGVALSIFLLYNFFSKKHGDAMFRNVAILALGGFLLFFVSSLFSHVDPPSHAAVLFFPLMVLYAFYALCKPLEKKWVQRLTYTTFASAMIMYAAIAMKNYSTISLYQHRDVLVRALDEDNYKLVGLRRYEK
ncbi:MAG TPA: hypothetical protein VEW28_08420 [Candidatus Kapabacteria bacterium]|nr:hypothetical protein [Candidatus Kapabacteria bacterium]